MNQLDPQIRTVWSIGLLTKAIVFSIVLFIGETIALRTEYDLLLLPYGVLSGTVFVLSLTYAFVYPQFSYRYWGYDIREKEVYIEHGVITKIKTTAPLNRIQHLEVSQSVFDRMFALARLSIYTAGTRGADLQIPGLPLYYAEQLRDHLKEITGEDAL
jgi:membrane protein YdbS with pleckstrin-like domain